MHGRSFSSGVSKKLTGVPSTSVQGQASDISMPYMILGKDSVSPPKSKQRWVCVAAIRSSCRVLSESSYALSTAPTACSLSLSQHRPYRPSSTSDGAFGISRPSLSCNGSSAPFLPLTSLFFFSFIFIGIHLSSLLIQGPCNQFRERYPIFQQGSGEEAHTFCLKLQ